MDFLHAILDLWWGLLLWLIGLAIVFGVLSKIMPCNPSQPMFRKEITTDLIYSFVMPIFNRLVRIMYVGFGVFLIFNSATQETLAEYMKNGFGPLSQLPIWLQAAIIFLVSDVILYWTHRWFHTRNMWPFHAIHHSTEHVDWLSTYRFHPVNIWLSFTLVDSIMLVVGFSPVAVALMGGVNTIYSAMVHANLNWTFGSFKYIFASPVFHRWHHTAQEEGMDKNFAPTFPLLDVVFGTFYMPEGKVPEHYGVAGAKIPGSFVAQLVWPFKEISKRKKTAS